MTAGRRGATTDAALPLFGDEEHAGKAEVDETFATAHRVHLDEHSWVEHVPGWLTDAQRLFEHLIEVGGWEQRHRWMYGEKVTEPRLTAEYPVLTRAPQTLQQAARTLTSHYGVTTTACGSTSTATTATAPAGTAMVPRHAGASAWSRC